MELKPCSYERAESSVIELQIIQVLRLGMGVALMVIFFVLDDTAIGRHNN